MRCFFGIPASGAIQGAAKQLMDAYRDHPAMHNIRWSTTQNWHLTVRFLGQTTDEQRLHLIEYAKELAQKIPPFEITTNGILILPQRRPKVFCLSIRINDSLAELFRSLNEACLKIDFEQEKRPFLPHITVGRWHSPPETEINKISLPEVSDSVQHFHLYQSESTEHGSVYTPIESFYLTR